MPYKKIKKCQSCFALFNARRDAKTCSSSCRKRLQRSLQAKIQQRAARLESAVGQEFHRLAAGLLSHHVICEPLVLADEAGSIQVAEPKTAEPTITKASEPPQANPVAPDTRGSTLDTLSYAPRSGRPG